MRSAVHLHPPNNRQRAGPSIGCGPPRRSRWGPHTGPPRSREGPSTSSEIKKLEMTTNTTMKEETTMNKHIDIRPGGLLFAMVFGLGLAPSTWAATAVGTTVSNTASAAFTV